MLESGFSSASSLATTAVPWLPRPLHFLGRNRFESARKLAQVHCSVLVTHGTQDEGIPVALGRRLFAAANEPKRLELVEGGDHNLVGNGGEAYLNKISGFLQNVLAER